MPKEGARTRLVPCTKTSKIISFSSSSPFHSARIVKNYLFLFAKREEAFRGNFSESSSKDIPLCLPQRMGSARAPTLRNNGCPVLSFSYQSKIVVHHHAKVIKRAFITFILMNMGIPHQEPEALEKPQLVQRPGVSCRTSERGRDSGPHRKSRCQRSS